MSGSAAKSAETKPARIRVGIRFSLLLVALATVALTAAAVHWPWAIASRDNLADVVRQLNREIAANVSREVERLLDGAGRAQETLRDSLRAGVIDVGDRAKRNDFFFSILKANPHFSWVSFGYPNGDFAGVQRRDPRNYRVVWSVWDRAAAEARREEAYFVRDDQGRYIHTQTKTRPSDYAAFERQWYRRAAAKPDEHIWSDVYIFANSGQPGLNTAVTYARDGALVGVISIAIELRRLGDYLGALKIAERGKAFVINRKGEMIAYEDPREVAERADDADETSKLRTIGAGQAPMLRVAAEGIWSQKLDLAALKDPVHVRVAGREGEIYYVSLAPTGFLDWIVGTVVPEADFTARTEENLRTLVYALLGAVLLIALLSILVSHRLIIRPLRRMMALTGSVERFELEKAVHRPSAIIEIDQLSRSLPRMSVGLGAFRRYLSADLVRTLLASGIEARPGGERRTLTVMFTDLEGFTAATERLGHRIMPLLNRYLDAMTGVIVRHGGTVDKYIGDSIMAFWNAPARNEEHALAACRCALDCQAAMALLRAGSDGAPPLPFNLRIGLNTGRVVVGNIGSDEKLEYTVIGDPVNLANRIEGLNKSYGTGILIGQITYEEVKYDVVARRIDSVAVRGREETANVHELLALNEDQTPAAGFEWVAAYERAYDAYQKGEWRAALEGFRAVIAARGSDGPSAYLAKCCEQRLEAAPAGIALVAANRGASSAI
jgi:adenylate cyclase